MKSPKRGEGGESEKRRMGKRGKEGKNGVGCGIATDRHYMHSANC